MQQSGTTKNLHGVQFNHGNEDMAWACGDSGMILYTSNGGASWPQNSGTTRNHAAWAPVNSGTNENLNALPEASMASNLDWLMVGDHGLIWRSTNFGTSWFSQNSRTMSRLTSAEFSSTNDYAYCGDYDGMILKTTDNGVHWGVQQSHTTKNLHCVFFYIDNNTGYAVGDSGTILKTTDGGGSIVAVNGRVSGGATQGFSLSQNFPNPFNPATVIRYQLPGAVHVTLGIYDITGKEVRVLAQGMKGPGVHQVTFDAGQLPTGMYLCTLVAGEWRSTRKLLLLR